jgi:hypothetical protein
MQPGQNNITLHYLKITNKIFAFQIPISIQTNQPDIPNFWWRREIFNIRAVICSIHYDYAAFETMAQSFLR